MFRWFWRQLLRRRCVTPRSLEELGSGLEALARSGAGGWLLAQERARLEFIAARERFVRQGSEDALQAMLLRLYHLESTNAVVQSLLNEQRLEEMVRRVDSPNSEHDLSCV
jgi:hypothetical protein